jgi:hypothetical protein
MRTAGKAEIVDISTVSTRFVFGVEGEHTPIEARNT